MNAFTDKGTTLGANLLTIAEFAEEKNTSRVTVARHIEAGKIVPKLVGKHQHVFIDAKKYADYTFDTSKINKRFQ